MGYGMNGDRGDYVPHGFRSSFSDWSGEVLSLPRDVPEMALAPGHQKQGGGCLPAQRPVCQAPQDDAGVGRLRGQAQGAD